MKVSRKWLEQYIPLDGWDDATISNQLSLSGTAVESIEQPWKGLQNIVVGKVTEARTHPNNPKLRVCQVDIGRVLKQIVCGDPYLQEEMHVVVALPKAQLWNGNILESTEISGVLSEGMMLSLEEMGFAAQSDRIFSVPSALPVGTDFCKWLGINDTVFDLEVTSNRPDELSMMGIAREIQAISHGQRQVISPKLQYTQSDFHTSDYIHVSIDEPDLCYRYISIVIKNIQVSDSPLWLIRHLVSVGMQPINNVVDLSNFVLMEMGHPVHVFDLRKIQHSQIRVRKAKPGESMIFLDGQERVFSGQELLITDGASPIALAGVMGGLHSSVDDKTQDILIEVAYFHPVGIRKTSKQHNLSTDASYRFERGVDPNDSLIVVKRLAHLIQSVSGGGVAKTLVDVNPVSVPPKVLHLRQQRITSILGAQVSQDSIVTSLENLGMGIQPDEKKSSHPFWIVTVPTYRPDIEREIDLIEEVGRINGYDKIPSEIPRVKGSQMGYSEYQRMRYKVRDLMLAQGFNEISPLTMIDPIDLSRFQLSKEHVWVKKGIRLLKPLSEDVSMLRPSTFLTMIRSVSYNSSHQQKNGRFFEIGTVFWTEAGKYREKEVLGWSVVGKEHPEDYLDKRESHFYTVKGSIEEVLYHLQIDPKKIDFRSEILPHHIPVFFRTQSASIWFGEQSIGVLGMIRQEIAQAFDIRTPLYMGEIDLEALYDEMKKGLQTIQSSPQQYFPPSRKDFSLLVKRGVEIGIVLRELRKLPNIESVQVLDVYKGKNIPDDMTSVTLTLVLRAEDHTFSEDELTNSINEIREVIISHGLEIREG